MEELRRFVGVLDRVFARSGSFPPVLARAKAVLRVLDGEDFDAVVQSTSLPRYHLRNWVEAVKADGLFGWLGKPEPTSRRIAQARQGIAQMVVGALAEERFEAVARDALSEQFRLEDQRGGRTDTDYRLIDARGRPVCRFNVKFHGTLFRESREYVGLDPSDCFALATYKIYAALRRQEEERLPYVFLIVSVPTAPRALIEQFVSDELGWVAALTGRKIEEAIVENALGEAWVAAVREELRGSEFRVISARRAYRLLQRMLFERVHALRLRGFNRLFRGAEINMHLSLTGEMVSFSELLRVLEVSGIQGLAVRLERGEI